MTKGVLGRARCVAALAWIGCFGVPSFAAGFHIFEHGTEAMGLANAVTGSVDDPSAMYFNPGGLAFVREQRYLAGLTLIRLGDSEFAGGLPSPGPVSSEQADALEVPPHFYWARPIQERATFGVAVNAPFGLSTEWDDPDNFAGRFISERAALRALDVTPTIAWRLSDRSGLGVGLVLRASDVELDRRIGRISPFGLGAVEVAKVELESDLDLGIGFNVGFQQKVSDFFSWGATYRSEVEVDYSGEARFAQRLTGVPDFDAAVAQELPFGQDLPIETAITFPATASLGLSFQALERLRFETNINWAGWSSFDQVDIRFTANPELSDALVANWGDAYNYRVGFALDVADDRQWRFGYYFDETPQPDTTVGPLLPDADRNGLSVGYGQDGENLDWDVALLYVQFEDRVTSTNRNGFNGTYETETLLLGGTIGW